MRKTTIKTICICDRCKVSGPEMSLVTVEISDGRVKDLWDDYHRMEGKATKVVELCEECADQLYTFLLGTDK